ncbi:hypothetical protein ACFFX1_40945 [Dactylosporangium sucinum]|uniref:Uncharacterized protein n=1 Tax=Dactylosporangium sucinum TaxID=1424081 RepID=A0A917WN84_9ACTN|nr:hypothetical protein [Dactylosporangium sucinum]GGM16813.1 hypothetical protein GCM10007977_017580 [Dactylosporangium sucinum]
MTAHRVAWTLVVIQGVIVALYVAAASAACAGMLLVMATPPGWVLFDWYVG